MSDNYLEYAVDQKAEGKNLRLRVLLVSGYILAAVLIFVVLYRVRIVQLVALLPLLLLILVLWTWRYVSVTHEYIIATGEISFAEIYSNRRRKEVLRLRVRDVRAIEPAADHRPSDVERVYDFRGSEKTPDAYWILFRDDKDRNCLAYFEATAKALRLLAMYNPAAVRATKKTRY